MSWFGNLLKEPALYWEPPIRDGLGGYSWGIPVEFLTRWEHRQTETTDETGKNIIADTVVWATLPFFIGGYVMQGTWKEIKYPKIPPIKEDEFGDSSIIPGEYRARRWAKKVVNVIFSVSMIDSNVLYNQLLLK